MTNSVSNLSSEVLRLAEERLRALLQMGLAADARAMQFGTGCTAIAAILVTLADKQSFSRPVYLSAGLLVIAAIISFWSGRAVSWDPPGYPPSAFTDDLANNRSWEEVRPELIELFRDAIKDCEATLKANGKLFRYAKYAAVSAPIVSLVAYAGPFAIDAVCRILP